MYFSVSSCADVVRVYLLVVVNVRISTHSVIEADVQVVPQPAVQNHVSHHVNSVLDLKRTRLIHQFVFKLQRASHPAQSVPPHTRDLSSDARLGKKDPESPPDSHNLLSEA